jgi:hypothetical protein
MSLIIDIKIYIPDKDKFEDYGWSVCPLLQVLNTDGDDSTNEYYVNSGVFSLPVYKGRIKPDTVESLLLSHDTLKTLSDLRRQKIIEHLGTTTVIPKIVDTQRKLHFRKTID